MKHTYRITLSIYNTDTREQTDFTELVTGRTNMRYALDRAMRMVK